MQIIFFKLQSPQIKMNYFPVNFHNNLENNFFYKYSIKITLNKLVCIGFYILGFSSADQTRSRRSYLFTF